MSHRDFRVQVLSRDLTFSHGTIPDYQSCSVTWQRLGVGTASLTVPERGAAALRLLEAHTSIVPVLITPPADSGLPRWSGRVVNARAVRSSRNRVDQIQATMVSEWKMLQKIVAAPVPTSTWAAQASAEHDTRTGGIVTVAKAYIQANIDRLAAEGRPTPLVIVPTAGADTSPVVTLKARNDPIHEVLLPSLKLHGYDMQVDLWVPGDPQPPGLSLSAASLVVTVSAGRSQPYVKFTDLVGGVRERAASASHPEAAGVVIGGPGEGTARVFQKEIATDGRVEALGRWAYPEEWLDATDAETAPTRTERGVEKLFEYAGTGAVDVQVNDGEPWRAGPTRDYWINDLVRAQFSGVEVSDRIDRVTATDNPSGFEVSAIFGSSRDTETPDVKIARTINQLRAQLAALESGR